MCVGEICPQSQKQKLYTFFSLKFNVRNLNQVALFRITYWLVSKVMFRES